MVVQETIGFANWITALRDVQAKGRILARLRRIELTDNYGDHKVIDGVIELRFHFGPGYRVYAAEEKQDQISTLLLLLVGGDKKTQDADLTKAKELAEQWRKERKEQKEKKNGNRN